MTTTDAHSERRVWRFAKRTESSHDPSAWRLTVEQFDERLDDEQLLLETVFVSVDPVRPSLPAALVAHGASRRIGGRPAAAVLAHSAIVAQFVAGAV